MQLLLIDGECTFCQSSVQFIMKRDNGAFHFASLQSEIGQRYVQKFQLNNIDSVILIKDEQAYTYSDAVIQVAKQLTVPYKLAVIGYIVPKKWRDVAYRYVAKNRHKLMKNKEVCEIPSPSDRARFLQ